MPLPEGFSEWEHLQTTLMQTYNRVIRDEFNDVGDETWDEDITTPRGSLRVACTLKDDDSATMTVLRLMLFYFILGQASALQTPVYGIPIPGFQSSQKFMPQVCLYFQESLQDIEPGYSPVTGEVKFRLQRETPESITEAEARSLANKIRSEFGSSGGLIWKKGRVMVTYTDLAKGYKLHLLCRTKSEGREMIQKILSIQNHTPDWERMNVSENEEPGARYPAVPPHKTILGKSRRLPRSRPVADVRFRYASLHIWGMPNPVDLVDISGTRRRPLVEA